MLQWADFECERQNFKIEMGKLSQYERNRIVPLRTANTSISKIVKILENEDGINLGAKFFALWNSSFSL